MKKTLRSNIAIKIGLLLCLFLITYLVGTNISYDVGAMFFFIIIFFYIIYFCKMELLLKCMFIISILLSILYSYYLYTNSIINFPDTIGYLANLNDMLSIESISLKETINLLGSLHVGYQYMNYVIFLLFKSEFALYLMNILMSKLAIMFFYYYLGKRYEKNIKILTTISLLFSVQIFIFTSDLLKDSLVLLLAMLVLYIYEQYLERGSLIYIGFAIILISALTMTRIYSGVGLALGIGMDYLINSKKQIDKFKIFIIGIISILIIIISPLNSYISMGIRFVTNIELSGDLLRTILKTTISFFLSPVFWNTSQISPIYIPILLDSMFFLVFFPLLIFSLYKFATNNTYRKDVYIYILPIFIHVLALGVQYGTGAIRQRIAVYPFIILLYSSEICKLVSNIKKNRIEDVKDATY